MNSVEESLDRIIINELTNTTKLKPIKGESRSKGVFGRRSNRSSIVTAKDQKRLRNYRASTDLLVKIRKESEVKLPSKWLFWKKKTKQEKRHERLGQIASDVEQGLEELSRSNRVDVNRLKALQNRMRLGVPEISRLFRILCQRKNTRSIRSQIECSIKPAFKEDGQLR